MSDQDPEPSAPDRSAAARQDDRPGGEAAPEPVAQDDLLAALRISDRSFAGAPLALLAQRVAENRANARAIRRYRLEHGVEPALRFEAEPPSGPNAGGGHGTGGGPGPGRHTSGPRATDYAGDPESLAYAGVEELGALLRAGAVTAMALARMYLDRLNRYGPGLHCVVTRTEDLALSQAARADEELAAGRDRGPLHGIPWGAKDLLATRGIPTTWGVEPCRDQTFDYDAAVVRRLDDAGAVLVAKLSMGEYAMGDVWFGGQTRNPWNPERGSSGSSAGSASAVAAGLVGFAIGTETFGSIVSPSVECGTTGLRPTYGRVSRHGAMALAWSLDRLGPMTRRVEDCARVLEAIAGPDNRDPTAAGAPFHWDPEAGVEGLRVGYLAAVFEELEEPRRGIYQSVLDVLREIGLDPRPIVLPWDPAFAQAVWTIIAAEAASALSPCIERGDLDRLVGQAEDNWPNLLRAASLISAVDYIRAQQMRAEAKRIIHAALQEIDVLVSVPLAMPLLTLSNLAGAPALITRCGTADGMPQSVEFTGRPFDEASILRVGRAYERATPWHRQWPAEARLASWRD